MYCLRICSSIVRGTSRNHFNKIFGCAGNQSHAESFTRKRFASMFSGSSSCLQHRRLKNSPTLSLCERKSSSIQTLKQLLNRCFVCSVGSTNSLQSDDAGQVDGRDGQIVTVSQDEADARRVKIPLDVDGYMLIDHLVKFLRREGAMDLCVISTSGQRKAYVDYFVIVSGASARHLRTMAKNLEYQFRGHEVRGVGKSGHVTVEGLESEHWMVLDIGNAVVHFFLPEVRELYELEKLWTLGPCYDDQYRALLEEDKQMDTAFLGRITDEKGTIGFE